MIECSVCSKRFPNFLKLRVLDSCYLHSILKLDGKKEKYPQLVIKIPSFMQHPKKCICSKPQTFYFNHNCKINCKICFLVTPNTSCKGTDDSCLLLECMKEEICANCLADTERANYKEHIGLKISPVDFVDTKPTTSTDRGHEDDKGHHHCQYACNNCGDRLRKYYFQLSCSHAKFCSGCSLKAVDKTNSEGCTICFKKPKHRVKIKIADEYCLSTLRRAEKRGKQLTTHLFRLHCQESM